MARNEAPKPTGQKVIFQDEATYEVYTDGSFRRFPRKLKGKANVKAAKRARRNRD